MNEITMIPIELLFHHPENPRLELGDLTELAESIKSQGILQNLTVVQRDNHYVVLIGNRRMEAAKLAGLKELPCVIVKMDKKDQIATMLTENMHRSDLTVYEQAQGVQMMMDLGLTEGQISEMTGFSRTTVKRRSELAKLDKETLKKKCAQLTVDDMDKLMKVKDLDKRNELLKKAGTGNFQWSIDYEIKEQKREENYRLIRDILLQAGCTERNWKEVENFWETYEFLPYGKHISLDDYEAGKNILPEDDRELFFCKDYSVVKFYAEKQKASPEETEENTEEKEKAREAEEAWARLEEIENHARESRESFLENMSVKQKDTRKALEWLMIALVVSGDGNIVNILPDYEEEELKALPGQETETDLDMKWMRGEIANNPQIFGEVMNELLFEGADSVQRRWNKSEKPKYCRNLCMITGYEWLADFGYPVSDDEMAYVDGTLDCYGEAEK